MKTFVTHVIVFFLGIVVALGVGSYVVNKGKRIMVFETSLTNQKVSLSTLNFLNENKIKELEMLHSSLLCAYLNLPSKLTDVEARKLTIQYFQQQGRNYENECDGT